MLATYSAVLRRPFDLERRDSQLDQSRNQVIRRQVLRAQEILNVFEIDKLAVADDLVRHAAGLGALAPVCGPAAQRLAGQALPRIGHAERAVDEDLDREVDRFADPVDFGQRQLAGQDDARAAQLARQRHPFGARDRHLGRRVNLKIGRDRPDEPDKPEVLHDHRVDAGRGQLADSGLELGKLVAGNTSVLSVT